jgi:hypothetical protein
MKNLKEKLAYLNHVDAAVSGIIQGSELKQVRISYSNSKQSEF